MTFRITCLLLSLVLLACVGAAAQTTQPAVVEEAGAVNVYTTHNGVRSRALSITPEGSLIAGGVSTKDTPLTNVPPVMSPDKYDNDVGGDRRNWIHDFYFGRYETPGEGQPRLHVRGLIMWGRGDSPDIQLGRTGPDNTPTAYGPPEDTAPGTSLGKVIFTAWGERQFQGDIAGMYARNDTVPTGQKNPGSLHLGTAGESERGNAWRDMIDRLVIRSNGFVAIGDEFTNPTERLHVKGNIRADGTIVSRDAPKVELIDPSAPDNPIAHAAVLAREPTLTFRGQSRLVDGRAVVELPAYFESLASPKNRTVTLTNVDGFERLAVQTQTGAQVRDGRFVVRAESAGSAQPFNWEVHAELTRK